MSKRRDEIGDYIHKKIQFYEDGSESAVSIELARLRRGIGHAPGDLADLYGAFLKDMPKWFWNNSGYITREEWACYTAISLFALHQQGNSPKLHSMHTEEKISIGSAIRKLSVALGDNNADERMQKKLQMLITSKDMAELAQHLKGIITMLRGEGISLNYVLLAQDLYDFQFENQKQRIGLKWGQDYFRKEKVKENEE